MRKLLPYFLVFLIVTVSSCTKDSENPFDNPDNLPPEDTTGVVDADPTSFVGLHQNIFKPTCANSGCHDGTFEPDFRTIESSYNTLVYHSVVKNDPNGSYQYRVKPGSLSESIMWLRLNQDIDGFSGIMPLDADYNPESTWNANEAEHLSNISEWIMNGALDMFDNPPNNNDQQPGISGIYVVADGQPCDVQPNISIPLGSQQVTVWLSVHDRESDLQNFVYARAKMSGEIDLKTDSLATEYEIWQTPGGGNMYPSFTGEQVEYRHRFTFETSGYSADSTYYIRAYLKDPMHSDTTEIPQDGSLFYFKKLFSWQFVN